MSTALILSIIALYFGLIFLISYLTTRRQTAGNKAFFIGERRSPWYVVAIAMIGTSISGVTFISVPGMVAGAQCSYMQMVLGFVAGYFAVAYILLPLYYRLGLCSIYGYLEQRYGNAGYRLGAIFFLISKFLGCGVRMYLTALVLQLVLFDGLGVPFGVNVALTMLIVWLYTFRGGVKTLVWADMIQTLSLVAAVVFCIYYVCQRFFWKQFLAGAFTTIAMTGLDQDMMQKNLSCRTLRDAQKNVISYGFGFLPVNLLFLALGILLYQFAAQAGLCDATGALVNLKSDELFPLLATGSDPATGLSYLPTVVGVLFIVGLIAAAFSSAGSAVTALTTSFTLDILRADRHCSEQELKRVRSRVHLVNAVVMGVLIYLFRVVGNHSVIDAVYVVAGYTYGPLLGLYFFGLYTHRRVRDGWIPAICVTSPVLCYFLSRYSEVLFGGYQIGYELLLINGGLTALGLYVASINYQKS
jgi:Na+/proline symporter